MKFQHKKVFKNKKSRHFLGMYALYKTNKNNNPINSRFSNVLKYSFTILFIISIVFSLFLFSLSIYWKFFPKTDIEKASSKIGSGLIIPSITKDTLKESTDIIEKVGNNELSPEEVKSSRIFFIPFYLLIPILFIIAFIHETGHYLMCRINKIKVEEYGFGCLSIFHIPIPLVFAYVNPAEKDLKKSSKLDYISMVGAGVSMNIILGVVLLFMLLLSSYFITMLFMLNLSIILLNSLPFFILDGGLFVSKISRELSFPLSCLSFFIIALLLI